MAKNKVTQNFLSDLKALLDKYNVIIDQDFDYPDFVDGNFAYYGAPYYRFVQPSPTGEVDIYLDMSEIYDYMRGGRK